MGGRINPIMQTCFFAISGVLPASEAIAKIKEAIEKTYGKKGQEVVRRNFEAVDADARAPPRGPGARKAITARHAGRPSCPPRPPTSCSA